MYVPNNSVRLVSVPLDPSYRHTYTFVSASAQTNFFLGKMKYSLSDVQYVRQNRTLRVKLPEYKVLECTYLMWQNADVSDKWYYAFITGTNYCSPDVTEITFELDTLQTFYFDFQVGQCFVEREHSNNDAVGANLEPEPVTAGEWINVNRSTKFFTNHVVQISFVPKEKVTSGGDNGDGGVVVNPEARAVVSVNGDVFQNYYYPQEVRTFAITDLSLLNTYLEKILEENGADAISSIVQMPRECAVDNYSETVSVDRITNLDGYVPKNQKLLTYPYCGIVVSNMNGQTIVTRQEFFTANPGYQIQAVSGPGASLVLTPVSYKKYIQAWDDSLKIDCAYPVPWNYNLFEMYLIQNKASLFVQGTAAIGGIVAGAASIAAGTSAGEAATTAKEIKAANAVKQKGVNEVSSNGMGLATLIASLMDMARHPVGIKGQVHNDLFNLKYGMLGFSFESRSIRAIEAQRIDDFFSAYGYATNRLKKPNITGRASWNYVKCANPSVGGSAPAFALRAFENILAAGITFWHGDFIGDYSRANGIIGG